MEDDLRSTENARLNGGPFRANENPLANLVSRIIGWLKGFPVEGHNLTFESAFLPGLWSYTY